MGPHIASGLSAGNPGAALRDLAAARELEKQQLEMSKRLGQTYTVRAFKRGYGSGKGRNIQEEPPPAK